MEDKLIDELALSAAETPTATVLDDLLIAVRRAAELSDREKEAIDFMLDAWTERLEKDTGLGNFVLELCALLASGTPGVRRALGSAVKSQLPPYLAKQGLQRALGLRERNVTPHQIVCRFRNLLALQPNMLCWLPESLSFAKVDTIDDLTGSVVLRSIPEATSYRIPLEIALTSFTFFEGSAIARKLIQPGRKEAYTAAQWRQDAQRFAVRKLSAGELETIAKAVYVPALMNVEAFGEWWKSEQVVTKAVIGTRTAGDARSLVELSLLLRERAEAGAGLLSETDVIKLIPFFKRQRIPSSLKDVKLVAELLCQLVDATLSEHFRALLNVYRTRLPFWPEPGTQDIKHEDLDIWGNLPSKLIPGLLKGAATLYSWEYLAGFATMLPLKTLNALLSEFNPDLIQKAIRNAPYMSADLLVWIWKNRKGDGAPYLDTLTMENVINGIVMLDLPKAWGAAQRELKKMLIDDIGLIKTIIDNASDDVRTIIYAVQRAKGFNQGEQQSLLVKLSRHSDDLKLILEGGEGRKMMSAAQAEEEAKIEPLITSLRSFREKNAELENLLNVLIPENRVAIEEARSHGDFRENAEYDAAKERRRFLSSHRAQLEGEILNAQPIDFRTVNVEKHVIVGSSVEMKNTDGEKIIYHIVGAFDGHPDHACVAYRTPIGEALMGHMAGDAVVLPGNIRAVICKVTPLHETILTLLSE